MTKHFKNVNEMIKDLSSEKKFIEEASKELKNKNISKFLFTLRCKNNLTQKELANKTKCTQSRISKIESSFNNQLTIKDLLDYSDALNLQLEIGYRDKNAKIVDLIKYHALKIKSYLEKLVDLVKEDETMAKDIMSFHLEAYSNLSHFILKNIPSLHKKTSPKSKEMIHISTPLTDKLEKEENIKMLNA